MKKSLLISIVLLFSTSAWSATVQNIKNNKLLINLEGQSANPGDQYFLLDAAGKKKALIQIRQVKNNRAVAQLIKGKPVKGMTLSATPARSAGASAKSSSPRSRTSRSSVTPVSRYSGRSFGFLGSMLNSTMKATFKGSTGTDTSVDMKGMTFGALGYYDYALSPSLQLRAMVGMEQLSVSGTTTNADCDASTTCNVAINYLSMYGGAKYNLVNSPGFRFWLGASYGFLMAMSKSSTVLKTSEITSNQLYVFSGGMDFPMKGSGSYIPISIDYGMFPNSATVTANILFVRAGWAKSF